MSASITLRLNDFDNKLIRNCASIANKTVSQFIRDLVLDKIEDDFMTAEEEKALLAELKEAEKGPFYSLEEVTKALELTE